MHLDRSWMLLALFAALSWIVACEQTGQIDDDDDISEGDDDDDATDDDDDATDDDDDATADDDDDATADDDDDDATADDDDDDDTVDPFTLEQRVYLVDLINGGFTFTEPPGVGGLLQNFLPEDQSIVFTATSIDAPPGTIELLMAGAAHNGAQWEQQAGYPTIDTDGDWYNPDFEVGPTELTLDLGTGIAWLGDAEFGGMYAPDGSVVSDTHLDAMMDTVSFDVALGQSPGFICGLVGAFGISCQACPATAPNPGTVCLHVVVEGGTCPYLPYMALTPIP